MGDSKGSKVQVLPPKVGDEIYVKDTTKCIGGRGRVSHSGPFLGKHPDWMVGVEEHGKPPMVLYSWSELGPMQAELTQKYGDERARLDIGCKAAKEKIDFFFSGAGKRSQQQEEAINDVLYNHLTIGSTIGKHNVSCHPCWDYYQGMKQRHCGG